MSLYPQEADLLMCYIFYRHTRLAQKKLIQLYVYLLNELKA